MMQFDWTTFILEILNFLVLVWLLQRFLYRPVLAALDARQEHIHDETRHAEQLRSEAEALRAHYEKQMADWNREQENSRRQLDEELAQIRYAALEKLKQTLTDEEAKLRIRNQSLTTAHEAGLVREAANAAYSQAAAMLQRLASPQLTQAILDLFFQDLAALPDGEQSALRKAARQSGNATIEIISAHPLDATQQATLIQALSTVAGEPLPASFREDPTLIAGLRAVVGECQLHANLADELAFFRRETNHD